MKRIKLTDMKHVLLLTTVTVAASIVPLAGASPASASEPWWKLTHVATPTDIKPGEAKDEVQKVTVSATEGSFVLVDFRSQILKFEFFAWNATAEEVQAGLENLYGEGAVEVTGGPGDEEGTKPYSVAFVGPLADQPVQQMGAFSLLGCEAATGANCRAEAAVEESSAGRTDGVITLLASNLGDGALDGSSVPVTLAEKLPSGLRAVTVRAIASYGLTENHIAHEPVCSLGTVSCTYTSKLLPYEGIEMLVSVNVEPGAQAGETLEATASGGNAAGASTSWQTASPNSPTQFGMEDFQLTPEEEGGANTAQAGSHPFQLTTTLMFNERSNNLPAQLAKDVHVKLPPGLIGNPTPFPQCTLAQFLVEKCADDTAVGVARVWINAGVAKSEFPFPFDSPIWNLEPQHGEPARFGFMISGTPVMLDTSVRTGGDYGITVSSTNISQTANFLGSQVTFWGVPGDERHDPVRGKNCLHYGLQEERAIEEGSLAQLEKEYPCTLLNQKHTPPLLEMPTSCTGPLQTSMETDSWKQPSVVLSYGPNAPLPSLDGCNRLPFNPSISVAPDGEQGSTPTGLTVGIHVPQEVSLAPEGLGEADVKDTLVTLPEGIAMNPAAADGLLACSLGQIALQSASQPSCPDASKVGTVSIHTPLLPDDLTGAAYLAAQSENPFGSLVALYVVAQDPVSGTLVKIAGEVKPDPVTGQLVSTFKDTPQLPFEDFKIHFFGGARAPLSTPALCGSYTTTASIAPWSGNPATPASSQFQISSGPNGSACQSPLPFAPELAAGSTNLQAGAVTPLTMTMTRQDGQQNLRAIELHMPPGIAGVLASVKLCDEADANAGMCGPESLIGHTVVSVGLGGDPYSVTGGRVYVTGPYKGAPYGLSIVNPAKAGPFDLGQVIVRAKLAIDPVTAAITVTTDDSGPYAIPQILDGIPLQIKHVYVTIDRDKFTFNPTNCDPMQITGRLISSQGTASALAVPFQVTNCRALDFRPRLSAVTSGKASRANGTSLKVNLSYPSDAFGKDANIAKVKVELPRQLPSRLSTLQKACLDTTFEANPAACPAASRVGSAVAHTPILPVPLTGPAYFVSHGGAKFPELVIMLQGYGVTVRLNGETFISNSGVTSSTFRTVPDVPVGSFELTLPSGPFSALGANGNLCKVTRSVAVRKKVSVVVHGHRRTVTKKVHRRVPATLGMPTTFVAQNGVQIKRTTPVGVSGCPKHGAGKAAHNGAGKRGK